MKTVFVWPNTEKTNIIEVTQAVCTLLSEQHAQVLLPVHVRARIPLIGNAEYIALDEGVASCDFILSLGGDGTILRIAEQAAQLCKPLLGVNLGHLGFMTELECSELHKIAKVFCGKYDIDSRMMLELRVMRGNTQVYHHHALNDVTITKINPFRIIHMDILADGVPVTSFSGDGVIIATPTGSTAYSLAAGGPIIEPQAENIAVTPVCAHNLSAKSFVFAPEREICIRASGPDSSGVCISADGRDGTEVQKGDRIQIRKSKLATRLIRVKGKSFYHILDEKLSGEGRGR